MMVMCMICERDNVYESHVGPSQIHYVCISVSQFFYPRACFLFENIIFIYVLMLNSMWRCVLNPSNYKLLTYIKYNFIPYLLHNFKQIIPSFFFLLLS